MNKGKWFFSFLMDIDGDDGIGESMQYQHPVEIELMAENKDEALNQVNYNVEKFKAMSHNDLKKYCINITSDDTIKFTDFQLTYKEKLELSIPELLM